MLPSTEAMASLRHTSKFRRQTGIQRNDSSGVRISEAAIIFVSRREYPLESIARGCVEASNGVSFAAGGCRAFKTRFLSRARLQ